MVTILDRFSGVNIAGNNKKVGVSNPAAGPATNAVPRKYLAGDYSRARHPEKRSNQEASLLRKPSWLRVRSANNSEYFRTRSIVSEHNLHTVCEEAACPNIGECWSKRHATFLIMGNICTRACGFCNIRTGIPLPLDSNEPERIALATKKLSLRHVVITSVDRDDLSDGGASHLAATITSIRHHCPDTTIEILTPDFFRKKDAVLSIISASPDVFNHNLETVPSLYVRVRPGARYYNSLRLLESVKNKSFDIFTKSGIMLGLGEKRDEILQVMDDLRCARVDFLTIGQYLAPTRRHHPLSRYVPPAEFSEYEEIAYSKGFLMVSSSPLTRSSYHADEDFAKLVQNRKNHNKSRS